MDGTVSDARVEPARRIRLRWGSYGPRLVVGIALIVLGVSSVQLTTAYSLPFLAWGAIGQAAGWVIMPGSGWRRLAALFPAELAACLLLAGGGYSSAFGVLLWAWLLVRQRPRVTYLLILLPLAYGGGFSGGVFPGSIMVDYAYAWLVYLGGGLLTVACCWIARWHAARLRRRPAEPAAVPGPADPADSADYQAQHGRNPID